MILACFRRTPYFVSLVAGVLVCFAGGAMLFVMEDPLGLGVSLWGAFYGVALLFPPSSQYFRLTRPLSVREPSVAAMPVAPVSYHAPTIYYHPRQ